MSDDEFGDNLFDGVDEAALAELERPVKRQRTAGPASVDHLALAERILRTNFGYEAFRHEQAGVIKSLLAGDNALAIFPTGAGKSLCYQIPAIAFPELDAMEGKRDPANAGVTIVVSPLIALMKDQVDALQRRGIPADSIDSSKPWHQLQGIYAQLRDSKLRILYCAPERLNNEGFVATIRDIPGGIRLVAIDEAHCVSEWGHSFRPEYLKVARFVEEIKAERVICLTATATPKVAEDICKSFNIYRACVFKTSPYRPNLELQAQTIQGTTEVDRVTEMIFGKPKNDFDKRFEALFRFLRDNPGPTLVYVGLQQQAELHAESLVENGFNAAAFHAGLKTERKQEVQDKFMAGKIDIICATIAFGMGIDKPDIRNVVHWDLCNSVEEYSQQIGRAGRDGKPSKCLFFLAPSAFYLRQFFARGDLPSRRSLQCLIDDILDQARGLGVGDIFKVSHYRQEREFDLLHSPLTVIYATLELHFGLFRATTPEYTHYKYEALPTYNTTFQKDQSKEAKAIRDNAVLKAKYYHLDVNRTGVLRADLIRKLNSLDNFGHIKLHTSGVEQRYRISKALPKTKAEVDAIVDELMADLQSREKEAVRRQQQVVDLITGSKCFALSLAEHFGMELPDGKTSCGHCTFCMYKRPVKPPSMVVARTTSASIRQVLKATNVRDDPRFLTRIAFGIRSPRITQLKLDKHDVFRSLAHHSFDALLEEFTKVCDRSDVDS